MSKAARKIREWRQDPIRFVKDCFQVEPDEWQREALIAFASKDKDRARISLQACAGPGKSTVLSWCGWNFLSCYGKLGSHPKAAAISITADNLKDNLWAEMNKWRERSPFLVEAFEWTKERIFAKQHASTWFMSARSFSKSANADEQGRTLSGLHSDFVLYLIDESGDISPAVLRSAEQGLSNCEFGKILQAGNPTSHDGMLYAAFTTLRHQWFIIRITGDPDNPKRSPRIGVDWAKEQINVYGRDNPWVMAYILGEFPPSSLNTLLGPEEIERSFERHYQETDYDYQQKRLGVDVARFGDDRTVIFPRQGLAAFKPVEIRNQRSQEIAARIAQAKDKWGSEVEFIDDTGGFGAGVIDSLLQAGFSPQAINFSGKAIDPRYANKRAEMWFEMAEWVKRGGALPRMSDIVRELSSPQYTFQNGKFLLEPKDQIKKRLGFSPDLADALALTFAIPDMPANKYGIRAKSFDHLVTEFDPFDDKRT